MDYLSAVSELNYMTQIVIMLYEDNNKVPLFIHLMFSLPCCQKEGMNYQVFKIEV